MFPCVRLLGIVGILAVGFATFGAQRSSAPIEEPWYDFRTNSAYTALSEESQTRLEQVTRDFVMLCGALDMYADDHDGQLPDSLDDLTPRYLRELPLDPFVTSESGSQASRPGYTPSFGGRGYLYRRGAPGNRAWIVSSIGLPSFPYLSDRGNVSLGRSKGRWISGVNPVMKRDR